MYNYLRSCLDWPLCDVHAEGGLCDMIADAVEITRKTFVKKVDREALSFLEAKCGYSAHPSQGLTMAGDHHVRYYKSKLHCEIVYFFTQSAIEYVFVKGEGE